MNDLNLSDIEQLPEQGWGLRILSPVADELSYTRTSDNRQNCLLIRKNYPSEPRYNLQNDSNLLKLRTWINWVRQFIRATFKNFRLKQIKLQVKTDLNALEAVLNWYQQLEDLPIPKSVLIPCKIALAEGFTNAVNHAHENLPIETQIDLEILVFSHHLEIRIWDYGSPFDLAGKIKTLEER